MLKSKDYNLILRAIKDIILFMPYTMRFSLYDIIIADKNITNSYLYLDGEEFSTSESNDVWGEFTLRSFILEGRLYHSKPPFDHCKIIYSHLSKFIEERKSFFEVDIFPEIRSLVQSEDEDKLKKLVYLIRLHSRLGNVKEWHLPYIWQNLPTIPAYRKMTGISLAGEGRSGSFYNPTGYEGYMLNAMSSCVVAKVRFVPTIKGDRLGQLEGERLEMFLEDPLNYPIWKTLDLRGYYFIEAVCHTANDLLLEEKKIRTKEFRSRMADMSFLNQKARLHVAGKLETVRFEKKRMEAVVERVVTQEIIDEQVFSM